jgi:hypothetical protein
MKKHSKTGVEARFQGTVLGHPADPKPTKIEGGPAESLDEWCKMARERAKNEAAEAALQTPAPTLKDEEMKMEDVSEEVTQDVPGDTTQVMSEDVTQDVSGDVTQDVSWDATQDIPGEVTQTSAQDNIEGASGDVDMET